jgi:hypothetical protein
MPARRHLVSPQGGGYTFKGETLPAATEGQPYSQNIAGQVAGGLAPFTFTLIASGGSAGDTYTVSAAGVINGTPNVRPLLVTETGVNLVTETGVNLST